MTLGLLVRFVFCGFAIFAVSLDSAAQVNGSSDQVKANAATAQNRSELSDGSLVVHVSKIQSSATIQRQSGAFGMTVNGPQQGVPENLRAKKGDTFLTLNFSGKAKTTDFVLDTAELLLVKSDGTTVRPISFFECEYCMNVVGVTIGGPGSTSNNRGPYSVAFEVPAMGLDSLLFRVGGIDVGTIRELTRLLATGSTPLPKAAKTSTSPQ